MTPGILISEPVALNVWGRSHATPHGGRPAPEVRPHRPRCALLGACGQPHSHTQPLGPLFSRLRSRYAICTQPHMRAIERPAQRMNSTRARR